MGHARLKTARKAVLALALMTAFAHPVIADDADDCDQGADPTLRIVGCTTMLLSGDWTGDQLPPIYNNRGIAYNRLGLAQQAIDDYDAALRIDPDFLLAYINRGFAYTNLPQYLRAIEDFDHVIAVAPQTPIAYVGRGFAHLEQGAMPQVAIADFDKAIALMPNYADAYYYRGVAFRRLGEYGRAIADIDAAIELSPGRALYHREVGRTSCWAGDHAAAVAAINRQWALSPEYVREGQQMLTGKRLYRGPINGLADPATQSALKAWVVQGCP